MYTFILHRRRSLCKKWDNFHINIIQFDRRAKKYRRVYKRHGGIWTKVILLLPTQQAAKQPSRIVEANTIAQVNAPGEDGIYLPGNGGR